MNNDMFQKLLAGKRNELEYKLMRYYYNKDMETNRKVGFMFEHFADTLKDISHNNTYLRQDDAIQLDPKQIDDIVSVLGGLFLEYLLKTQGLTLGDALQAFINEFDDIPDQEYKEEDTQDEE